MLCKLQEDESKRFIGEIKIKNVDMSNEKLREET